MKTGNSFCSWSFRWCRGWALAGVLAWMTGNASGQVNGVLREVYTGIDGSSVSDLTNAPSFPGSPSFEEVITTGFEAPTDVMESYGQRMTAYVSPPDTGNYVFWIASDDASLLYLSADDTAANKQVIAYVEGWTSPRAWDWNSSQQSAPIWLVGGRRYYLEALMKEGGGGDNLAVRWQLPNGTIEEPIPNSRLQVFGLSAPQITKQPSSQSVVEGGGATFKVELARSFGAGWQWQRNGVAIPGATGSSYFISPVAMADNNSRYRCVVTNSYGSAISSEAVLTVQADTTSPALVSATTLGDPQLVTVLFSEPVEEASAAKVSNYALNNGASITLATLAGDQRTVVLRTSPLSGGRVYTLTINNVRDRAASPNTITPNSQRTFSLDFVPAPTAVVRGGRETPGPCSRNTPLVISEIMYNPAPRGDGREMEFVEIYNSGATPEDIGGFRLSGDISYTFAANTVLAAGAYLVVAPVPADVQALYGIANVVGGFPERLGNSGGTLRLKHRSGAVLLEVSYGKDHPWPLAASGAGHSLVLARPSYGEADPRAWTASDLAGGTPGKPESPGANPYASVVLNEVLAHTDDPVVDFIELFNYSSQPVDVSGCSLSDRPETNKFSIPAGTTIPARGFVAFDQTRLGFALSTLGETIYFRNPAGNRALDIVKFGPQENGVSIGRFPDGAEGWHELASRTPGESNAGLRLREVVINEIMFNPISRDDNDEYVELYNRSEQPVDVGGWRLTEAIDFSFPQRTVIAAKGYLVLARNAARLQANYPNLSAANTVGDFQGTLANGGERLVLACPEQTITTNNNVVVTNLIYVAVDEVGYAEAGRYSRWADGGGSSLELTDPHSDNGLMANWADSDESGKSQWTLVEHTGVLDNGLGAINELHLMLLGAGECLIDELEVREASGGNLVANGTFDAGLSGWVIQGNHVTSGLSPAGSGFAGAGQALHLRAGSGGDNGANRVETDLTVPMAEGNIGTIRGRARWLCGHPDVLMRLHGNHLEAVGRLTVPRNLGTPGAVNSRYRPNAGPAIQQVTHTPVLPNAAQAVTVYAQVGDPDGLSNLALYYRVDPATNYSVVTMGYNGAGWYSGTVPGQAGGALVAFYIAAADGANSAASSLFPVTAPEHEALVRFGDPTPAGGFGVYRLWMTQKNVETWTRREKLSNEPIDGTFVYGNRRVIYNAGGRYRGSPWIRPSYDSPVGGRCAYVWTLPEDDLFLGADELNLDSLEPGDRDPTALREVTSFWMAQQLGLPFSYQRYVHTVVNGMANAARGIPIYTDSQQPDSAYVRSWFADGEQGEIYKIDDWFEFNDAVGQEFNVDGRLELYTTTGGVKKQARYRWSWEKKVNRTLDDDYTSLFQLVDAMNAPDAAYVDEVERTINADECLTVFAFRHSVGDWDGYGYARGKNQFTFKPEGGKWRMLLWDLDFSIGCYGGHGPTEDLFGVNDPTIARLYNHPHFRRAYFNALHRIAYGPFEATNVVPFITANYNALLANGVNPVSPFANSGAQDMSVPEWIRQRRDYLIQQLAAVSSTFGVLNNDGNDFSTGNSLLTLTGTAPIEVTRLEVNGVAYPVVWTALNTWSLRLALPGAVNTLTVKGYDHEGRLVTGAEDVITVQYTGAPQLAQDYLVINEIMYNPLATNASFVEIWNRSTSTSFDLSGMRLEGVDFDFTEGTLIAPGEFLVIVNDVAGFRAAYGSTVPIYGVMRGTLDNGGETLRLVRKGTNPAQDVTVDEVTYDDDAPWPAAADGFGASLQLVDALQDNNRVMNWAAVLDGQGGSPQTLVTITNPWRYNQAGTEPAANWKNPGYNDSAWPVGTALLYVEDAELPAPKNTPLTRGPSAFYFRTGFNFTGDPGSVSLNLKAVLDDGAVIYLNGIEVLRVGMPEGDVAYGSFASRTVGDATFEGPFTISSASLVNGSNVLAVEVHQCNADSSDVVFGVSLEATPNGRLPYTPGAANSVTSGLPSAPLVWLNEIQPNNVSGPSDNNSEREPWVEVHNSSGSALDLTGFYLSDNYADLRRWAFPSGTVLAAGEFRLVWLDGEASETAPGVPHTSFRASATNGVLVLCKANGASTIIVDYLNYAPLANDRSYGSYPDGTPAKRQTFYTATPGAANNAAYPAVPVYVNEWLAGNTGTLADPADGDFEDWFELYNAGPVETDLSGFYLTDELGTMKWQVPDGTRIAPGGYLVVWADEEGSQNVVGGLHASFKLSLAGEALGLYAPNHSVVDTITFGQQTNDVSQGRWPDGNNGFSFMKVPSPGAANRVGANNTAPVLAPLTALAGKEMSMISFVAAASDADVGQQLVFTLDADYPEGASIHPESGVFNWVPTETQGPGNYILTVRVTDNGSPPLSDAKTVTLTVDEVNRAPALLPIGNRSVEEGAVLTLTAQGSDLDLPTQKLSYRLEPGAPAGAVLDPITGVFTWSPTEEQGPGDYAITLVAEDDGAPPLNASETITINVREVNRAPTLTAVDEQQVTVGQELQLAITAADPDLPKNALAYVIEPEAPAGAAIGGTSGLFTWTPTAAGTNQITVRVTDDGTPAYWDLVSFTVIVVPQQIVRFTDIAVTPGGEVTLAWSSVPGRTYRLHYKNRLAEAAWSDGGDFIAEKDTTTVTLSADGSTQRYYWVEQL